MTINDDLSGRDDYDQIENDYSRTQPPYPYSQFEEDLKKTPPKLPSLETEEQLTNVKDEDSYLQEMDSSEQACIDIDNNANKAVEITESTDKMGMDAPIDLVEQFKALPQEEQEYAMSCVADFKDKATLKKIKDNYHIFPNKEKIHSNEIIQHIGSQLGDYLKYFDAKENLFYLDEFREIDPQAERLCQTMKRAHNRDNSIPLMRDIIPKKTKKTTKRLERLNTTSKIQAQEFNRDMAAKNWRETHGYTDLTT